MYFANGDRKKNMGVLMFWWTKSKGFFSLICWEKEKEDNICVLFVKDDLFIRTYDPPMSMPISNSMEKLLLKMKFLCYLMEKSMVLRLIDIVVWCSQSSNQADVDVMQISFIHCSKLYYFFASQFGHKISFYLKLDSCRLELFLKVIIT